MHLDIPQIAHVEYTREILENGRVVKSFPPKRNLLLDAGLDLVGKSGWVGSFAVCRLGTGTTPTKRDSGNITFGRNGARVTASASFFAAADVNRILKFDSGAEMYVRAFVSDTQVDVDTSGDLPPSEGTIWYVEQRILDAQTCSITPSSTLDNGTTYDAITGTLRHRRTFLGAVETGNVVYKEIGWSNNSNASDSLLGRDLIPGGGDALVANQQYRVRVDLYVTVGPLAPVATPEFFGEWPGSNGTAQLDQVFCDYVQANGTVSGQDSPLNLSDSGYTDGVTGFLSKSTAAFPNPPAYATTGKALSAAAYCVKGVRRTYVAGSRKNYIDFTFPGAASGGSELADIRSVGWATGSLSGTQSTVHSVFRILLNNPQYKDPWWKLTFALSKSWGRVLIN